MKKFEDFEWVGPAVFVFGLFVGLFAGMGYCLDS